MLRSTRLSERRLPSSSAATRGSVFISRLSPATCVRTSRSPGSSSSRCSVSRCSERSRSSNGSSFPGTSRSAEFADRSAGAHHTMTDRYDPQELRDFATAVLGQAGVATEAARAVAEGLVEGDLYGHATHGLALLPDYIEEIERGTMETKGRPEVVGETPAAALWDARRLPGVWTTRLAVEEASRRAASFGLGAVSVRRSHHIACLAAYLEAPAREGRVILLFSSDPSDAHVAPFGGTTPVMTPNPIAAG